MLVSLALLPLLLAQAESASFDEFHRRGEMYVKQGDLKSAIPWLRRAYEIDPANYNNAFDYALACVETRSIDEARRVVNEMLARGDRSELHNLLGDIEEASGHTIEAARQYETAARADPSEKNVFDLGTELLNHKGFEQAIALFEFGVAEYPASSRMRVGLGIAYYSAGRYSDAVEALCKAVDLDPKDTRALDFLGKMHGVSPEMEGEVRKRLANFAAQYPDSAAANYYYAMTLDNPSAKERLLKRAISLNPRFAEALFELAAVYGSQDRPQDAIHELERVIQLKPGMKAAHYRLAQLYKSTGQSEKAREELRTFQSLP